LVELIQLVTTYLNNRPREELVRLPLIYGALAGREAVEIDEVLDLLKGQRLVRATFQGDAVQLTPDGRTAVADGCVPELILGGQYVAERLGPAVVHVVVETANQDETGGSGFFCADYPGYIATGAHVVQNRQILRIENHAREVVAQGPLTAVVGPNSVDIALIRCQQPANLVPIRIEWRREILRPLDGLLIFGYPPYPNRLPTLHHSRAELHAVTQDFRNERDSLIISSVTRPGSSGGPVLSERGFAIGIVDQENMGERLGERPINFFTATPTRYFRELQLP
jgi:S1-C subfamily serine protease